METEDAKNLAEQLNKILANCKHNPKTEIKDEGCSSLRAANSIAKEAAANKFIGQYKNPAELIKSYAKQSSEELQSYSIYKVFNEETEELYYIISSYRILGHCLEAILTRVHKQNYYYDISSPDSFIKSVDAGIAQQSMLLGIIEQDIKSEQELIHYLTGTLDYLRKSNDSRQASYEGLMRASQRYVAVLAESRKLLAAGINLAELLHKEALKPK